MVALRRKHWMNKLTGLTLIEVLIALAIVSIAMTAIIKATSQTMRSTAYLQDKTIAMWLASNVMNKEKLGLVHFADQPSDSETVWSQKWYWHGEEAETPNKAIKKITVKIYRDETKAAEDTPVLTLEGYRYQNQA